MPAKKTWRAYVVIKGCKKDFGIGVGVVGRATITLTDERGRGFDGPMCQMALVEHADNLLKQFCTVLLDEKVRGDSWNLNPQAALKKTRKKRT